MPRLSLQQLHFAYPGQPPLAAGWSCDIGGGVTLLHGDSGTGKSTLLRVLAGTLATGAGRLSLGDTRLDADAGAYRQKVFFIEPSTDRFDRQSGHDCSAALRSGDAAFDAARWQALVDGFALAPHLEKPMYMLSTGTKRKVWLASALASGRPLVLLDEPTGGLDAASRRCLWRALGDEAARQQRVVLVASAETLDEVPLAGRIALPLG